MVIEESLKFVRYNMECTRSTLHELVTMIKRMAATNQAAAKQELSRKHNIQKNSTKGKSNASLNPKHTSIPMTSEIVI